MIRTADTTRSADTTTGGGSGPRPSRADARAAADTAVPTVDAPRVGTSTVVEPDIRPVTDDGDHDRFAHYTRRKDAARAYVEGTPLRALCGKVWVPSRDPSRYPVCPDCEKIRQRLLKRASN